MLCRPALNDAAVEAALDKWRYKATNALTAATAVIYLPVMVLMVTEKDSPFTWPVQIVALSTYIVGVLCAVPYRADYRLRAWPFLLAGYVMALVINIASPEGPFARAFPVVLPVLTMVLLGVRAGRVAALAGIVILLFAPFLSTAPSLAGILTFEPTPTLLPLRLIWAHGAALTALLLTTTVLLDRFHQFFMQSLVGLERESAERSAAYRKLEGEMRERRRLEHEVARAGDDERRRLGVEIHDGVCQQLTGALLRSEALVRRLGRGEPLAVEELSALSSLLEEGIDEAHAVAQGLCPLDPDSGALATALRILTKRTSDTSGVRCLFEAKGDVRIPDSTTAQHLYRIAQEAVSNAARHAHATRIAVSLQGGEDSLLLQVEDNGDGIAEGIPATGMGLRTMAYRAHLLEGEFNVAPAPDGGTRVSCRIPRECLIRADEQPHRPKEADYAH